MKFQVFSIIQGCNFLMKNILYLLDHSEINNDTSAIQQPLFFKKCLRNSQFVYGNENQEGRNYFAITLIKILLLISLNNFDKYMYIYNTK